jgi:hypothetical protein
VLHPEFLEASETIGEQIDAQLRQRYGPLRTQVWVEQARPYQDAFSEPGMPNYLPPSSNGGGSDWA